MVVKPDGEPGDELGAVVRDGDTYTFEGRVAEDQFRTLARRAGGQDEAWSHLVAEGWSNGHVMFVSPEQPEE